MQRNSDSQLFTADDNTDVFDRAKLLYATNDDEELADMLIGVFLETVPATMTSISAAITAGDARALRLAAHSLKGSAGTITAQRVANAAHEVEKRAADGNLEGIQSFVDHLVATLTELRARLA